MNKPVKAVIATARLQLRGASEQKMPSDTLRALLHSILERYTAYAIKENKDFYTNENEVELDYDDTSHGYKVSIPDIGEKSDFYPVSLMCQDLTANADSGDWYRINLVKYAQFVAHSGDGRAIGAFIGAEWQGINGNTLKLNLTEDWVAGQRFRLGYRYFPQEVMGYEDIVPFPSEHTNLLETALAADALVLVEDNSADWNAFYARQSQNLAQKLAKAEVNFSDWLAKDVENVVIDGIPYNRLTHNVLRRDGRVGGNLRPQW